MNETLPFSVIEILHSLYNQNAWMLGVSSLNFDRINVRPFNPYCFNRDNIKFVNDIFVKICKIKVNSALLHSLAHHN